MQIICPLCKQPLTDTGKSWCCDNNHSFDKAKQGYTHLLPVQHKKSKAPGDDKNMVAARGRFLSGGYYKPLSEHINQLLIERIDPPPDKPVAVIDAGCGEGYYTSQLQQSLSDKGISSDICGIDISKFAVLAGAKRNKNVSWFVANSAAMPVADYSADILLSFFAPLLAQEFRRCLKPTGLLLVASTGPNHLIELRRLLYDEVDDKTLQPDNQLADLFSPQVAQNPVQYTIDLTDNQAIIDLLAMTPHFWRVSPQRKKVLDQLEKLTVSIDINLHCYTVTDCST